MLVILSKPGPPSKSDRSAIYSHVATYSHRRRQQRQQSQRQANQSKQQPQLASKSQIPNPHAWLSSSRDPTQKSKYLRCTVHEPSWLRECSTCQQAVQALKVSISGHLNLSHGNSDPFDAQAIRIDAEANYYLDIGFNAFETVVWMTGFRAYTGPRGWLVPRTSSVSGVDTGINLYGRQLAVIPSRFKNSWSSTYLSAVLAYHASAVLAVTGDAEHSNVVSKYLLQANRELERYKASGGMNASCQPEELLFRLMRSEMLAQRFADAMTHALDLKILLLAKADLSRLDLGFLLLFVYQANNLAIAMWTRPILEARWVEQAYGADWTSLIEEDAGSSLFKHNIQGLINNAELAYLLSATQTLFVHTSACLARNSSAPADKWYWLDARAHWLHIRLLNFIQDQTAQISQKYSTPITASRCMNMCCALTALLSLRYQKSEPMLCRVALTPASRTLLTKMWAAFSQFQALTTPTELIRYGDAILWVTFIAALVEDRLQARLPRSRQPEHWPWWRSFVEAVVFQGLCSWEDLRQRLCRFPYSEDETPLPDSAWHREPFDLARHFCRLDRGALTLDGLKHEEQRV